MPAPSRRPLRRRVAAVLGVIVAAIIGGGAVYLWSEAAAERYEAEAAVLAVGRLKAEGIAAWRAERTADTAAIAEDPLLAAEVGRFLADPHQGLSSALRARLESVRKRNVWRDIMVVDAGGHVLFSFTGHSEGGAEFEAGLRAALGSQAPAVVDLHVCGLLDAPHLTWIAPIRAAGASGHAGAIAFLSDANEFLYPYLEAWPAPSASAETLLARRAGGEVLFLNELRHRKGTALALRFPIASPLPAALAIRGRTGNVAGPDYRGVEVLAAVFPVAGTPWFVISKIDEAEILSAWRQRAGLVIALMVGLVGLTIASGLAIWRHRERDHLESLLELEAARRAALERHGVTLQSIGDGVITTDAGGCVELLNPVAESLTGWTQAEAAGRPLADVFRIVGETTREPAEDPVGRVLRSGFVVGLANHTLLIARDGTERPIADSAAPIRGETGGIIGVVLVFRDQSDERRRQRLLHARLTLLEYATTHTLDELLTKALDEIGTLVLSPIGFYHFVGPDERTISLQQWSARTRLEFRQAEGQGQHDDLDWPGVWADCLRERRPIIHNTQASLPDGKGLANGHAALVRELVVPVMRRGRVVAIVGAGNKATDYTERDLDTVASLADTTWEIVDRARVEQALSESEARYRGLVEHAVAGIFQSTPDGRLLMVNPALAHMFGYASPEELIDSVQDVGREFYADPARRDEFVRLMEAGALQNVEFQLVRRDGQPFWVAESARAIRDASGQVVCYEGVMTDITARKQVEADLRAERDRSQLYLDVVDVILVVLNDRGEITLLNRTGRRVLGFDEVDPVGQDWFETCVPAGVRQDLRVSFVRWLAGREDSLVRHENPVVTRDGHERLVSWHNVRLTDETGAVIGALSAGEDVTERRKLEEQFREAQKMESVGRLAGGVAHDYNNMLSVILGHAELALNAVPACDPAHENLQAVLEAATRSVRVTQQLLAFARRQPVTPRTIDLNDAVEAVLKMLRRLIGEDIDLRWLPAGHLWPVMLDPAQLDQILANLCVNARDAVTDVGIITIETDNVVFDEADCIGRVGFVPGAYVRLKVSDTGSGMDRDTLSRIFEPFFTTKEPGRGTGLGLATVYGIVKQNNGFINVYSEPGKGSTFTVYLPRAAGPIDERVEEPAAAPPAGRGETVLVVEDEAAILRLTAIMLERLGYRVLTAASPAEALQFASTSGERIHLLVSDVVMPGMNGRDLADQLAANRPDLKRLFISGYTADIIAHRGVLDEDTHFLQKPFTLTGLSAAVRAALGD
ncbi:MAG: PAS domain S-box protein [Acidobacteriota bacterium]